MCFPPTCKTVLKMKSIQVSDNNKHSHADDDWRWCCVCMRTQLWHNSNVSQKSQQLQRPNFCWSHNPPNISTTVGTRTRSVLAQELNKACPEKAKQSFKKTTIIKAAVTSLHSVELELDQDQRQNNSSDCTVSGSDYLHPLNDTILKCEIQDKWNLRGI